MTSEDKILLFAEEISMIKDVELKNKLCSFLTDVVPEYFWTVPASSSGKYHPSFSGGEGGLVRHTKMVVAVLLELLNLASNADLIPNKDSLIIACILHDTFKHGHKGGHTITDHPVIAADAWEANNRETTEANNIIVACIAKHMGQWGPISADFKVDDYIRYCADTVHLADYIASRKFFDKYKDL